MNNSKKPRSILVDLNITKDTRINIGNILSIEVGGLQKNSIGNSVDIIKYIDRKEEGKKNKVISFYTSKDGLIEINETDLMREYDAIFVVDTNTEIVNDIKRCIGIVGVIEYDSDASEFALVPVCHMIYEIPIDDMNYEKYTWAILVNKILGSVTYSKKQIGIVVDSFLGDIFGYNRGESILPRFQLPQNIKLMYASSDKSGDGLLNWAMKQCDKAANKLKTGLNEN